MASFERAERNKGFDRFRSNRWQMVPKGGVRYILLRNAVGLTWDHGLILPVVGKLSNVDIVEVPRASLPAGHLSTQRTDRVLKITGKHKGPGTVRLRNAAGTILKILELSVLEKRTVKVSFNFVKDSSGTQTRRTLSHASRWLKDMNAIYNGQANVEVTQQSARWVTVASDLKKRVEDTANLPAGHGKTNEAPLVEALGDPAAHFNIFFVWNYGLYEMRGGVAKVDTSVQAAAGGGNCIFQDRAGRQVGETIAHELGHHLGCNDHYIAARKRELMYGNTDVRGRHIPKADALTMNP